MELVDGESVRALLAREGPLPIERALAIAGQVLAALAAGHAAGIVHRGVKPENILVSRDGRAKVCDFGIAKDPRGQVTTVSSGVVGSALHMAPEQRVDPINVDPRVDLYSTFVVLYELLTGQHPIGRWRSPSEVRRDVPAGLDALIMRGLDTDRDRRPASASAALAELNAASQSARRAIEGPMGVARRGGSSAAMPDGRRDASHPLLAASGPAGRPTSSGAGQAPHSGRPLRRPCRAATAGSP